MRHQSLFLVLLVSTTLYALVRGGAPERIAAISLAVAAMASRWATSTGGPPFQGFEIDLLVVDIAVTGLVLWLALNSARFWPLWMAALLMAELLAHLGRAVMPSLVPSAYLHSQGMWGWGCQILLAAGTFRHQLRLVDGVIDRAWKKA